MKAWRVHEELRGKGYGIAYESVEFEDESWVNAYITPYSHPDWDGCTIMGGGGDTDSEALMDALRTLEMNLPSK